MKNSSQGPEVKRGGGSGPGSRREPERRGDTPAAASLLALQSTLGDAGAGDEAKAAALRQVPPDRRVAVIRGVNDALGNRQTQRVVAAAPSVSVVAPRRVERPTRARGGASGKGEVREEEPDELGDRVLAPRGFAAPPPGDGEPRGPSRARAGGAALLRQRAGEPGLDDLVAGAEERALARRTVGAPLPEPLRAMLEEHMECDLGDVRIHTDDTAADLARDVGARAFTVGLDISFARGAFAPQTAAGLALLVHEVKHVEQHQRGLQPSELLPGHAIAAPHDHLEREAEAAAQRIVAGALSQGRVARPASASAAPSRRHRRSAVYPGAVIMRTEGVGSSNTNYPVGAIRHIRTETELPIGYVKADKFGKAKGRVNALQEHNKLPVDTRVKVTSAAGAAIEVEVTPTDDLGGAQTYAGKEGVIPQSAVTDPTQESKRTPKKPAPIVVAAPKKAANAAPAAAAVKVVSPPNATPVATGGKPANVTAQKVDPKSDWEVNHIRHTKKDTQFPRGNNVEPGADHSSDIGATTLLPAKTRVAILEVHRYPAAKVVMYRVEVLSTRADGTPQPYAKSKGFIQGGVHLNTQADEDLIEAAAAKKKAAEKAAKEAADNGAPVEPVKKPVKDPKDETGDVRRITVAGFVMAKDFWMSGPAPGPALPGGVAAPVGMLVEIAAPRITKIAGQDWYRVKVADKDDLGVEQKYKGCTGIIRVEKVSTQKEEDARRAEKAKQAELAQQVVAVDPQAVKDEDETFIRGDEKFEAYATSLRAAFSAGQFLSFFKTFDNAPMKYMLIALKRFSYDELKQLLEEMEKPANRKEYFIERVHAAIYVMMCTKSPQGAALSNAAGEKLILEFASIKYKDQQDAILRVLSAFQGANEVAEELLYRLSGASKPKAGRFLSAKPQGIVAKGMSATYAVVRPEGSDPWETDWCITKVGVSLDDFSYTPGRPDFTDKWMKVVWKFEPGHYVVNCITHPYGESDRSKWTILRYDQEVVAENDERSIFAQAHASGSMESFEDLQAERARRAEELLEMGTPENQQDVEQPDAPFIRLMNGKNPATEQLSDVVNSYALMQPDPRGVKTKWYVVFAGASATCDLVAVRQNKFEMFEGRPAVLLDRDGADDLVELWMGRAGLYELYCEQYDAKDELIASTSYIQNLVDYRARDKVKAESDKLLKLKDRDETELKAFLARFPGKTKTVVPLKATFSDSTGLEVRSLTSLYLVYHWADEVWSEDSPTGKLHPKYKFTLLDFGRTDVKDYSGDTQDEALKDFNSNNKYPKGRIRITVPTVRGWGYSASAYPNGVMYDYETTGSSDAGTAGKWIGGLGMVASVGGMILMLNPATMPLGLAVSIAGSVGAAVSSGINIYDELRKKKPDPGRVAIDVLTIATSLVAALHSYTKIGIESALKLENTELLVELGHRADKYRIWENVGGISTGVLILADKTHKVVETLCRKHLSGTEMTNELAGLFWELVEQGAVIALQRKDLADARKAQIKPVNTGMTPQSKPKLGEFSTVESPMFPAKPAAKPGPQAGALDEIHGSGGLVPLKKKSPWVTAEPNPALISNAPTPRKAPPSRITNPGEFHGISEGVEGLHGNAGKPAGRPTGGPPGVEGGAGKMAPIPDGMGDTVHGRVGGSNVAPDGTLISARDAKPARPSGKVALPIEQTAGPGTAPGMIHERIPERKRPTTPQDPEIAAMMNANELQEAAWAMRSAGMKGRAATLEQFIESALANERPVSMVPLGGGVSESFLVTFESGIVGVWKPNTSGIANHGNEIGAYRISRAMGGDLVPVTVERALTYTPSHLGGSGPVTQVGSLQYYVKDSASGITLGRGPRRVAPELQTFDFVIGNTDRFHNPGNWVELPGGRKIAIDHGLAFNPSFTGGPIPSRRLRMWFPTPESYGKFKALGAKRLKASISGYVDPKEIEAVERRYNQVVQEMDELIAKRGPDAVFSPQFTGKAKPYAFSKPGPIRRLMRDQATRDRRWQRWLDGLDPLPPDYPPSWVPDAIRELGWPIEVLRPSQRPPAGFPPKRSLLATQTAPLPGAPAAMQTLSAGQASGVNAGVVHDTAPLPQGRKGPFGTDVMDPGLGPGGTGPLPGQGPVRTDPFPGQGPGGTGPLPGQGPVRTDPFPGQGPVRTDPLPGQGPVRTDPFPGQGPMRTDPFPGQGPVRTDPFPGQGPGEGVAPPAMVTNPPPHGVDAGGLAPEGISPPAMVTKTPPHVGRGGPPPGTEATHSGVVPANTPGAPKAKRIWTEGRLERALAKNNPGQPFQLTERRVAGNVPVAKGKERVLVYENTTDGVVTFHYSDDPKKQIKMLLEDVVDEINTGNWTVRRPTGVVSGGQVPGARRSARNVEHPDADRAEIGVAPETVEKGFYRSYGFERDGKAVLYPSVRRVNRTVKRMRKAGDPNASAVLFEDAAGAIDTEDFVRSFGERGVIGVARFNPHDANWIHYHDSLLHLPGYLIMPNDLVGVLRMRAKVSVTLYDAARNIYSGQKHPSLRLSVDREADLMDIVSNTFGGVVGVEAAGIPHPHARAQLEKVLDSIDYDVERFVDSCLAGYPEAERSALRKELIDRLGPLESLALPPKRAAADLLAEGRTRLEATRQKPSSPTPKKWKATAGGGEGAAGDPPPGAGHDTADTLPPPAASVQSDPPPRQVQRQQQMQQPGVRLHAAEPPAAVEVSPRPTGQRQQGQQQQQTKIPDPPKTWKYIPGGSLAAHEKNEKLGGELGHTLTKHVDRKEPELMERLKHGGTFASSFETETQANRVVNLALEMNEEKIARWLENARKGKALRSQVFEWTLHGVSTGYKAEGGRRGLISCDSVRVTLVYRRATDDWYILTAHPI